MFNQKQKSESVVIVPFERVQSFMVGADRWIILPFHLGFRSPCEAGGSPSSWPPFYSRHLSDPHPPLSSDIGWNMDYHKGLLAVRG